MPKINLIKSFVTCVICFGMLLYMSVPAICGNINEDKKITVIVDYIGEDVRPGDNPLPMTDEFFGKLFPEINNPQNMEYEDLNFINKSALIHGGLTFILRDDFNNDGIADVAFIGKYVEDSTKKTFLAILSIERKKVTRKYFEKFNSDQALLLRVPNYKEGMDAIFVTFNYASEDCFYLFWQKDKYVSEACQAVFFE